MELRRGEADMHAKYSNKPRPLARLFDGMAVCFMLSAFGDKSGWTGQQHGLPWEFGMISNTTTFPFDSESLTFVVCEATQQPTRNTTP